MGRGGCEGEVVSLLTDTTWDGREFPVLLLAGLSGRQAAKDWISSQVLKASPTRRARVHLLRVGELGRCGLATNGLIQH